MLSFFYKRHTYFCFFKPYIMLYLRFKTLKTFSVILILLLSTSCKKEIKNLPQTNETKISSKEKTTSKTYTRNADCDAFYESIDFSSLCFTSDKTPKIQPSPNAGNNCHYKILLEEYGTEIYVLVNYHDYENSIYDDYDMAKHIHEQGFQKKRDNKYLFTTTTDANIEDDAYFGFHKEHKQRSLHVRMNNVVVAIQVEGIHKTNPCLISNAELIKFAKLIIERVKN